MRQADVVLVGKTIYHRNQGAFLGREIASPVGRGVENDQHIGALGRYRWIGHENINVFMNRIKAGARKWSKQKKREGEQDSGKHGESPVKNHSGQLLASMRTVMPR